MSAPIRRRHRYSRAYLGVVLSLSLLLIACGDGDPSGTVTLTGSSLVCPGPAQLGCGLGDEQFVTIPAGSYERGSWIGQSDERPVRTVTITRAFQLQRTEVTQQQWRAVMGTNPSGNRSCALCPVNNVSWLDVQEFITSLNQRTGLTYRLPTEAEWEYAARAGTTGESYGPQDQVAWSRENSGGRTQSVATKQPNAWGLHDMLGNVWEWVHDWYSATYYGTGTAVDPSGPATGAARVLRGGSCQFPSNDLNAHYRLFSAPSNRYDGAGGFRLARIS